MIQLLLALWILFERIVKRVESYWFTSTLQVALIHVAFLLSVEHSGYFSPYLKHISLTIFIFWQINRLNKVDWALHIIIWVLYLFFNVLTIFQVCYNTRTMGIPLILFRSFNIGMLIVCADMRLSADNSVSPQSEITIYNVIFVSVNICHRVIGYFNISLDIMAVHIAKDPGRSDKHFRIMRFKTSLDLFLCTSYDRREK